MLENVTNLDLIIAGVETFSTMLFGRLTYPIFDLSSSVCVKSRKEKGKFEPVNRSPRKKHGLIICDIDPDTEEDDRNTIKLVYQTLLERGFTNDNIYLLEGKKKPGIDLRCHTMPSDRSHLKEVLENLYQEVSREDSFFMCSLTHGERGLVLPLGQSTIELSKGSVKEKELEELLSDIHPDHSLLYFNSCFSGGFAERLGKGRTVVVATCRKYKMASGNIGRELEKRYGKHNTISTLYFYSALRGKMPNGENLFFEDVSIEKAFDYSALKQYMKRPGLFGGVGKNTPQLFYDKIDPGDLTL